MATEHVKKFVFSSQSCGVTDEKVDIYIPEVGLISIGGRDNS